MGMAGLNLREENPTTFTRPSHKSESPSSAVATEASAHWRPDANDVQPQNQPAKKKPKETQWTRKPIGGSLVLK